MVHATGIVTACGYKIDVTDILHLHLLDEPQDELRNSPGIDRKNEAEFLIGPQLVVCLTRQFIRDEA